MYNAVVCRYHEIATKGNNRGMFERCLVDNIRHLLRDIPGLRVDRVRGRVWVAPAEAERAFTDAEIDAILAALPRALGLESFSAAVKLPPDIEEIRRAAVEIVPPRLAALAALRWVPAASLLCSAAETRAVGPQTKARPLSGPIKPPASPPSLFLGSPISPGAPRPTAPVPPRPL